MKTFALVMLLVGHAAYVQGADEWPQLQGDALRSGNAETVTVSPPLGLVGAVPLTDGIYAAPVVSEGKVVVIDGSGVVSAIDARTLDVLWRFKTRGGPGNCNNVATPAMIGNRVHVGTMAGYYYVLDRDTGALLREIDCQEPILASPAAGPDRVYFATLGARVYAVQPDGELIWTWDFVKEVIQFNGNRWSGADWRKEREGRVTWRDHFVCSRDICLLGRTIVMPAGGRTVFLDDAGASPQLRAVGVIPDYAGSEYPRSDSLPMPRAMSMSSGTAATMRVGLKS
jgi:hypothetical protein